MAALPLASASASIVTLSSPSSPTNKALKTTTTLPFISTKTQSLSSRKSPMTSGASRHLPLPRVAAPRATPTSYENHEVEEDVGEHGEESSSSSKFSWRDHWYPISLIEDLDPQFPTQFQLLGGDLVLWFDRSTRQWVALDDKCPHRLAPLSEGRIDEGGNLQCSYHGWSFDGRGSCVRIPQALKLVLFSLRERALQGFLRCSLKACSSFGLMRMAWKELVLPSLPGH